MAEYFRDEENQDVLLFIDNIFRFTQANSEVSALLGRIPSAVGYQPTLATDLGGLQERITTTTKGSITSVQARTRTPPAPCSASWQGSHPHSAGSRLALPALHVQTLRVPGAFRAPQQGLHGRCAMSPSVGTPKAGVLLTCGAVYHRPSTCPPTT